MEQGNSIGNLMAYCAIWLFWLVVALVLLRTLILTGLLLGSPARRAWGWLVKGEQFKDEQ